MQFAPGRRRERARGVGPALQMQHTRRRVPNSARGGLHDGAVDDEGAVGRGRPGSVARDGPGVAVQQRPPHPVGSVQRA